MSDVIHVDLDDNSVFQTPFALEIQAKGLTCLGCPDGEAENMCLAERFLLAYEIKEKYGLLTDLEKELLPGLRLMTKALLETFEVYGDSGLDEFWLRLHKRDHCLQPAVWQEGGCLMIRLSV